MMKSIGINIIVVLVLILQSGALTVDSKRTKNQEPHITWAEKLNFPKGKKVIMLHADDIGMCEEANIAAINYLKQDKIQSAAIMMPCAYAPDMINWAKKNPKKDIGLHLTLTSEWKTHRWGPVSPMAEVPTLLDPDKKLWRDVPGVVTHASAAEVEKEIRAQIEKSIALGYRPDHIDTHMGTLYGHPDYIKAFFKVAEEYNIPANVIDVSDAAVLEEFRKMGYPITDEVVKLFANYKLPKLDYFTSVPNGSSYEEKLKNFKILIQSLKPGLTEIIFHPSVETENLKTITGSWQQRVWEAKMFSDPEVIKFLKAEGIVFTNWNEIMKRFKK
ncbi:polysaccharide deacetylase family protein [Chryseolinea sp. H1M3-3]|uniref:polysaccharide deacetylase family protein n=1 Tax=Chryseolinea sp. H1M3-3 TaxID=3034144 RepID=UPI0023EA8A5F|nr:polysaccharide deacetylase family protein [Chryseolinea sp. H1M3-3]